MRKHRKSPSKIAGQFAPRLIEMMRSPAFRVLSLSGHRILARLEIELADHGGRDNGKLPVTFADLKKFGITNRDDIARGIRELCALGFVELTRTGRAGNGEYRMSNLFRITYLPADSRAPTNEWRLIGTIEEAERLAHRARKKNLPVTENVTGPVTENVPNTGHGKRTKAPNSPVTENGPLSRQDLAISEGHRPEYGFRSVPNPTRSRRRHDWSRIRAAVKLDGGHHGES
jgi:hypothetical protein